MTNFEILLVGVAFNDCPNTDKVWGLGMTEDGRTFRFWGKRTGTQRVQFFSSKKNWETWHAKTSTSTGGEYTDVTHSPHFPDITRGLKNRIRSGLMKVA